MNTITLNLDKRAKTLARDYLHTEASLLSVLMEMRRKKVFQELTCSGIFQYCEQVLKFSRAQAYYFKTVAEASVKVPELKQAVTEGELSLSQARRIVPVLTPGNQSHWIDRAKTLTQTDLEKAVTEANPKARPREKIKPVADNLSELKVPIDDKTEKNLIALKDVVSQKLGRAASLSDVIAFAAKETRNKYDPEQKARRARKVSLGNSKKTKLASLGNAQKKDGHVIPNPIKHQVILRNGFQCSHKGPDGKRCQQKRWLQFHHLTPVAQGGSNTAENLILLCQAHHANLHSRESSFIRKKLSGSSGPHNFTYGSNLLPDEAELSSQGHGTPTPRQTLKNLAVLTP